jgi:hypothetical protein
MNHNILCLPDADSGQDTDSGQRTGPCPPRQRGQMSDQLRPVATVDGGQLQAGTEGAQLQAVAVSGQGKEKAPGQLDSGHRGTGAGVNLEYSTLGGQVSIDCGVSLLPGGCALRRPR